MGNLSQKLAMSLGLQEPESDMASEEKPSNSDGPSGSLAELPGSFDENSERIEELEAHPVEGLATNATGCGGKRGSKAIDIPFPEGVDFVLYSDSSHDGEPLIQLPLTFSQQFITSKGNEYFCEIDEDYLTDRFNLTGLNAEIEHYQYALDLVTDVFDLDCSDEMREQIEVSARKLYGLVHARYITTTRGLQKMLEKFKKGDFGRCPRVMCNSTRMLPCGLSDNYGVQKVKLYCGSCEDLYSPKSSKHSYIDGAYFGTTFHNMLFQVYPGYLPTKSIARYEPRVFGFKQHAAAALQRWQEVRRQELLGRLKEAGEENPFVDDEDNDDGMDLNEGEEDEAQEL